MISRILKVAILSVILILALFVRRQHYAEIPVPGQSSDEYGSYGWVGLSLIEIGTPVGISGLPGNENTLKRYVNVDRFFQVVSDGDPLTINYPWLDHPPLLGLITGGFAHLSGARVFEDVTALLIRRPMILIGTVSVGLAMIFSWINFGFLSAVLTGLIYGTTPLAVIGSRMVQAENGLIPMLLLCLIFLSLYIKTGKDRWLVFVAIVSGIATLFKFSGFACHLLTLFALLYKHRSLSRKFFSDIIFYLFLSLPITLLYLVYGMALSPDTLKNILLSNYERFYGIGPAAIMNLIRDQRLTQYKFLPEVWVITSWIAFFIWIARKKINPVDALITFSVIAYLIVYILFGSQPYGWYAFPFWPLLFIILSRLFSLSLKDKNLLVVSVLLSLIIAGENIARLVDIGEFQKYASLWRFGISGVIFLLIVNLALKKKLNPILKIVLFLIWGFLFYTNLKYLGKIDIDFWWKNVS